MNKTQADILWFDQLNNDDVPLVGGKNASLGEMYQQLKDKGVQVPNGYAITAHAYRHFLEANHLPDKIKSTLATLDTGDMDNLSAHGKAVRTLILNAEFPHDLKQAIVEAYGHLCKQYGEHTDVAVRSSATAEDLPDASFAGQQDTYLNIHGEHALLDACKRCFASLFTNRAISYREDKGFDHFSIALSIGVQKMVRSDRACSGVMFSIDTESGFKDAVFLTASYGLGENIVQGAVNPDEYYIFKPTLRKGKRPIITKELGEKSVKMVYTTDSMHPTKNVTVPQAERDRFCLTDDEILTLARWAVIIEDHYSARRGRETPMDMEWAKDGITNQLFIVQARPETVHSQKDHNVLETYRLTQEGKTLITGASVGERIGSGKAHIIKDVNQINTFQKGEVLVTDMTDPDWEPIMKIAAAIVTNRGGRTCHAAIISRELGIPCVVGTDHATEALANGQEVTVDCSQGKTGYVYAGKLDYVIDKQNLDEIPETKTKIMMNVGNPDQAFELAQLPNDGVGLAREEFIITSSIQVHPLALINYHSLDAKTKKEVDKATRGYDDKLQFYVDKLAQGIGRICAAFYPKPVIVRMADFKTNEYATLVGGKSFEPTEDNPMIGWRGASRYYDDRYKAGFILEIRAFLKVIDEYGLDNIKLMVPFCRTVEEGRKVLAIMAEHGLPREKAAVYAMCEIPSNVILADRFMDVFDGFSIGSNDLTQLTLGVDRDSELVAHVYDERDEATKALFKEVIEVCARRGKYIGFCGQAVSDWPEMAEFVVRAGISSISVNPDTVVKTRLNVHQVENS